MTTYIKRFHVVVALALAVTTAGTGNAYQFVRLLNPDDEWVTAAWGADNLPVPYYINQTPPRAFSLQEAVNAVRASFDTWEAIPTSSIAFRYVGTTSVEPFIFGDLMSTIGFVDDPEFEGTGILGATQWTVFLFTGEIAEADIVFNQDVPWAVSPEGTAGRYDFQSTATHEIGHFLGLGHSAVGVMETSGGSRRLLEGSAIMYPFAFPDGTITGRTPTPDDIVGASALYPTASFSAETGSLSGTVTKSGFGVAGAHIMAFNPYTDELIGFFTDQDGLFTLPGLEPGPYVVRVNPISDPLSPEDFGFDEAEVDLNFGDAFLEGRAEIRPAQVTSGIEVEVQP